MAKAKSLGRDFPLSPTPTDSIPSRMSMADFVRNKRKFTSESDSAFRAAREKLSVDYLKNLDTKPATNKNYPKLDTTNSAAAVKLEREKANKTIKNK